MVKKHLQGPDGSELPGKPTAHEFVKDIMARIRARQNGKCAACGTTVGDLGAHWQWTYDWAGAIRRKHYGYPPRDVDQSRMVCGNCANAAREAT